MKPQDKLESLLEHRHVYLDEVLKFFDTLEPVDIAFVQDRWKGKGLHTGHPLDGLLEVLNWHGKELFDPDHAHPLVYRDLRGTFYKVAPNPWLLKLSVHIAAIKNRRFQRPLIAINKLMRTRKSQARLRMMHHRGKTSVAMVYDRVPIQDHFRRVDQNTLLGLMDYKRVPQPLFFVLERDGTTSTSQTRSTSHAPSQNT